MQSSNNLLATPLALLNNITLRDIYIANRIISEAQEKTESALIPIDEMFPDNILNFLDSIKDITLPEIKSEIPSRSKIDLETVNRLIPQDLILSYNTLTKAKFLAKIIAKEDEMNLISYYKDNQNQEVVFKFHKNIIYLYRLYSLKMQHELNPHKKFRADTQTKKVKLYRKRMYRKIDNELRQSPNNKEEINILNQVVNALRQYCLNYQENLNRFKLSIFCNNNEKHAKNQVVINLLGALNDDVVNMQIQNFQYVFTPENINKLITPRNKNDLAFVKSLCEVLKLDYEDMMEKAKKVNDKAVKITK